ncbi:hypothetical protein Tco_0438837 [Tanacetum coccineum]
MLKQLLRRVKRQILVVHLEYPLYSVSNIFIVILQHSTFLSYECTIVKCEDPNNLRARGFPSQYWAAFNASFSKPYTESLDLNSYRLKSFNDSCSFNNSSLCSLHLSRNYFHHPSPPPNAPPAATVRNPSVRLTSQSLPQTPQPLKNHRRQRPLLITDHHPTTTTQPKRQWSGDQAGGDGGKRWWSWRWCRNIIVADGCGAADNGGVATTGVVADGGGG